MMRKFLEGWVLAIAGGLESRSMARVETWGPGICVALQRGARHTKERLLAFSSQEQEECMSWESLKMSGLGHDCLPAF